MGSIDIIKPLLSTALSSSAVNKPRQHRKNFWNARNWTRDGWVWSTNDTSVLCRSPVYLVLTAQFFAKVPYTTSAVIEVISRAFRTVTRANFCHGIDKVLKLFNNQRASKREHSNLYWTINWTALLRNWNFKSCHSFNEQAISFYCLGLNRTLVRAS